MLLLAVDEYISRINLREFMVNDEGIDNFKGDLKLSRNLMISLAFNGLVSE